MRLGRFKSVRFEHNDCESLGSVLHTVRQSHPRANVVVCVEGVYSMDGDLPPLREIRGLCDRYLALLAIDDAHGTGVLGPRGFGAAEHFGLEGAIDIVMGTFSKTFATCGGFVAGPTYVIEFLRSFARSYMFSASLPTPVVFEEGIFVNGVEYPVVPPDRQRLRATVMATMERSDLERAAEAFGRVGREVGMV